MPGRPRKIRSASSKVEIVELPGKHVSRAKVIVKKVEQVKDDRSKQIDKSDEKKKSSESSEDASNKPIELTIDVAKPSHHQHASKDHHESSHHHEKGSHHHKKASHHHNADSHKHDVAPHKHEVSSHKHEHKHKASSSKRKSSHSKKRKAAVSHPLTWNKLTNTQFASYRHGFPSGSWAPDFFPLLRKNEHHQLIEDIHRIMVECKENNKCLWDGLISLQKQYPLDKEQLVS